VNKPSTFSYIDLFAGCGGLSLGFERAGAELILAVERSPMAAETFRHNLIAPVKSADDWKEYVASSITEQVSKGLLVKELQFLLDEPAQVNKLADLDVDVIAGGPPCQGFSLAGRRNPEDLRNQLPWQFLQFVEKVSPKIVVIENVVGMRHKFSADQPEPVFDQLQQALRETGVGYEVQAVEVNAMHYGAPQHRPRLMIIGLRQDIAESKKIFSSGKLWKSDFLDSLQEPVPAMAPIPTITSNESPNLGDALSDLLPEVVVQSARSKKFVSEMKNSAAWGLKPSIGELKNHVRRKHTAQAAERFELYQALFSMGFDAKVISKDAVLDEQTAKTYLLDLFKSGSFPAKTPTGKVLAKSPKELVTLVWNLRTKKHSQRVLPLDKVARTVVTIGDDYVHPVEPRTFTVRELARFQGFPDSFEFRSKETTGGLNRRNEVPQYSQVGNAVSPFLAKSVGELINNLLK
jgi:DNA (cytosine-5)-methyltransferase 1